MAFHSIAFLFLFLPLVLILYYLPNCFPKQGKAILNYRVVLLIISGLIFYAWGDMKYLPLLLASGLVNYGLLYWWSRDRLRHQKRIFNSSLFLLIVIFNILYLASGKYVMPSMPLGISFYVFKFFSAAFDMRNILKERENSLTEQASGVESANPSNQVESLRKAGKTGKADKADKVDKAEWKTFQQESNFSFRNFALYICFFPELSIGPISRFNTFTSQIGTIKLNWNSIYNGLVRFLPGLFVKVLIADPVSVLRNELLSSLATNGALEAWLSTLLYSIYIYLDFASYSAMAIGLGEALGFTLPENFNDPYSAVTITDFWRRWHMSLSFWFRDYVYIPLGGNRKGRPRQLLNICIVWALTGIWHGNHLNFLLWGLFFALILIAEKLYFLKASENWPNFIKRIFTLFIVNLSWVLFAFPDKNELFSVLGSMFGANGWTNGRGLYAITGNIVLIILGILASSTLLTKLLKNLRNNPKFNTNFALFIRMIVLVVLFALTVGFILDQSFASFLYTQF